MPTKKRARRIAASTWAHWRRLLWSTSKLLALAATIGLAALALVFAALVYPGELSQLSPRLNRWLYDRAATGYEHKWATGPYRSPELNARVEAFARSSLAVSEVHAVLDLGCGTGRGIRLVFGALPADTRFVGVDYSGQMLTQFRQWLVQDKDLGARVEIIERDLGDWLGDGDDRNFGLVMMLEVGEFLPAFPAVLRNVAAKLASGGGLLMTRPAGAWCWFFPRRGQSRRSLTASLLASGFDAPQFLPWRSRYELVFASKR
jgi:SAM-dependent methyltransferase